MRPAVTPLGLSALVLATLVGAASVALMGAYFIHVRVEYGDVPIEPGFAGVVAVWAFACLGGPAAAWFLYLTGRRGAWLPAVIPLVADVLLFAWGLAAYLVSPDTKTY